MSDADVRSTGPGGTDPTKASIARVYDAALGGKDNYEIDRQIMQKLAIEVPEIYELARDNRSFLIRATRFLAHEAGVRQFLDCGSGLPTAENTHQVAQRIAPDSRVVYVDNDPVVLAHGRAILEENDNTTFVAADIFQPRKIMENEVVRKHLDFSRPIALFQVGTLHHYLNDDVADLMREYVDALPSGSYVVFAHFFDPEDENSEVARKMEDHFVRSPMGSGLFRTRAQLEPCLAGLELVPPGMTLCADWWPDGPRIKPLAPGQNCIVGVIGRKP